MWMSVALRSCVAASWEMCALTLLAAFHASASWASEQRLLPVSVNH